MFVAVTITLLFNRELLHTFEILIEAYFCEFLQQIAGHTSQLVGVWLFLRREGRLKLLANNVFL